MFTEDGHWTMESAQVLTDLTIKALTAVHEEREEDFAHAMGEVGDRFGERGIYATCHAICGIARAAVTQGNPGFASMVIPDGTAPEAFPEELQPDIWAIRFMVGGLNGDDDHMMALWSAQRDGTQQVVQNVIALFHNVAALLASLSETEKLS